MDKLSRLVDSKSKAKLLACFMERLDSSFSVSGLGRLASLPKASVSAIITQWAREGLVLSREQGRNKMVFLNSKFYLLPELKKIFEKTRDFQKPLVDQLKSLPALKSREVKAAVLFGSRARKDYTHFSDLDVLIAVENKNSSATERIFEEFVQATKKTGVRFSPVMLGKKEMRERWKEKDQFMLNALNEGKIIKGGKWLEHLQAAR